MRVEVKYIETSSYSLKDGDTILTCDHELAEVEPPCCNGNDCGCYGRYSVYCWDCNNEDLTDSQVEAIIEASIPEPAEYEPELDYAY